MQIVYLSVRPGVLNDTLRMVERNMDFINDVCIISPSELHDSFIIPNRFETSFITDRELVNNTSELNDHSLINFRLRSQLGSHPKIHSEFIMSDDDYRPLKPINLSLFKSMDKYNAYFFHDLTQWKYRSTPFDNCLHNSGNFLKQINMSTLAYASHMPQIIDKRIFSEAMEEHLQTSVSYCEWSIYFNYGISKHPERFNEPLPYVSMNWPDYPNIWKQYVKPGQFEFENFYSHLYNVGDLYAGLPQIPGVENQIKILEEKKRRLEEYIQQQYFPWLTHRPFTKYVIKLINVLPLFFRKRLYKIAGLSDNK